jgi:3-keto-disaccharide hydrolase
VKRLSLCMLALLVFAFTLAACAGLSRDGWATLIDGGTGLDNFNRVGDANWRSEGGAIVADRGKGGFLVSKTPYTDFEIRAEFWAESNTNSGVFLRCADPTKIGADTCYEVNIWDIRPEPKYATGAIVNVAAVPVPLVHKAGGRWNVYEITAKGTQLTVKLNGVQTVSVQDGKHVSGPFALQYGFGVQGAQGGPIKWRKVQIRPL